VRRIRAYTFKDQISIVANARVRLRKPEGRTNISETGNRVLRAFVDGSDMRMETTAQ
jgi:hypothetical protein